MSLCGHIRRPSCHCSITFTEHHTKVLVRVTKSRFMRPYRSTVSGCQCPKRPNMSRRSVKIKSESSGKRSSLCTPVCAVSSATGVRNKVRFLHGHHKFPNALQLITRAGRGRRGGQAALRSFYALRNTSERSLSRGDAARGERSETKEKLNCFSSV